jgi:uncharacterized membrane protein
METQLWAILLVIIAGVLGALSPIYLKRGSDLIKKGRLDTIYKNKPLIIGILINGVGTVFFIPALKAGELSVLYPIVGLSYVWVCVFSKFLLKEEMNLLKWIGIFIVILGVSFIGFGA